MDYLLPCFGRSKSKDDEREPLLPKHANAQGPDLNGGSQSPPGAESSDHPAVDKLVDVLVALEAGKLPSQDQISGFLQVLLKSELLKEDKGKGVPGNGPTSKQGKKILQDTKTLLQALLQFGMEKNDDDKLQELYFQVIQIDPPPVQVNLEVSSAYRAGETLLDVTKQAELKDQAPMTDQLAFDAATFLHALRTLCEIFISSSLFRLVLIDLLSIFRDLVTHAAVDVERAALHVQHAVSEDVASAEELSKHDDIITTLEHVTYNDVKDKGKEVAEMVTEAAQEVKHEWQVLGEDATEKTKERMLGRIQELLSRLQKDKASRSAMRAILILIRKYTEIISSASETASEVFSDAFKQTTDSTYDVDDSDTQTPNYPPHLYSSSKHEGKTPFIDVTSDALLSDFKDMLQRLAEGYSLDGLLSAFGRVVRHLDEVPLVLGEQVNSTIQEKLTHSANTETQHSPSPVVPSTPEPPGGEKGKNKENEKNKKQKGETEQESPLSSSPSESRIEESPGNTTPTEYEADNGSTAVTPTTRNPIQGYFFRIGEYLDKALDEPGWVMSTDAAKILEVLFDDGVELVNVVGESIIEVGEGIIDSDAEKPSSSPKYSHDVEVRRKFKNDLKSLVAESEAYIAAFERDKTTMRLFQALDVLGGDLSTFLSLGGRQSRRGIAESVQRVRGWTSWAGWVIPKVMRMLPLGVVPIPTIEFKKGNIEGVLQATFVKSVVHSGQKTPQTGASVSVPNPIQSSLVPDEVVVRESTEVRIDMADSSSEHPLLGGSVAAASASHQVNGVRTTSTSRVHMHMDGVRARVEGMGYYFKYTGACGFGYEDEGVLSMDVGMGALHAGLGADIDLELESESEGTPFGSTSESVFEVPRIVLEDAAEEGNDADDWDASLLGAAQPLFRVADVRVTLRGLRFRLDESRHWILNKLFVQPLAGPTVAHIVREALEKRVRMGLEALASGLGEVVRAAERRGEERRLTRRGVRGGRDHRRSREQEEGGDSDSEEGFAEIVADWWGAIMAKGPAVFGRSVGPREGGGDLSSDETEVEVETHTTLSADATTKGVIFTNTTTTTTTDLHTTDQPHSSSTPAMVYDKPTGSMQIVDLSTMEGVGTPLAPPPQQQNVEFEEEETVLAIGGGAQLFPGKAGPYGESNARDIISGSSGGVVDGIRDGAKKAINGAAQGIQRSKDVVESVEERWQERTKKENNDGPRKGSRKKRTWRSDAFDFH